MNRSRGVFLLIAASAALTLAVAAPAVAQKAIYTGGSAGAYNQTFCPPLPKALGENLFQGYTCTPSGGTVDNLSKVALQPTNVGFAQLDVLAREFAEKPELAKKLSIVRQDIACEGLWMVTKNPSFKNYGDILGRARRINFVLPPEVSGSTASFKYLQSIDPEGLGRATNLRYVPDATAVINHVAGTDLAAVGFFVQWADPRNGNIKLINEKGLSIIPVVSMDIIRAKVGGNELYQVQEFSLTEGGYITSGVKATTACTPVALVTGNPGALTNRNAVDDQKDLIKTLAEIPSAKLLPAEGYLAAILRNAKRVSGKALTDLAEGVEQARKAVERATQGN